MNNNKILEICKAYDLGVPKKEPSPVIGGLIHKMWLLETEKGKYAIKELDSKIMEKPGLKQKFELSEFVAQKLKENNVPAVVGLKTKNGFVENILDVSVIVYEWLEGKILPVTSVSSDQAFMIGQIIGEIHKANLDISKFESNTLAFFSEDHWQIIIEDFLQKFPESKVWLSKDDILKWNKNAENVVSRLNQYFVISHGDIDQKNVIWKDEKHPFIIDWESVGKINPGLELMDAALNWAGLVSGHVDEKIMKAVVQGYKNSGLNIEENGEDVLRGCIIKWLAWLEFNMRRAVNSQYSLEDQNIGFVQTKNTMRSLNLISDNFDKWATILS